VIAKMDAALSRILIGNPRLEAEWQAAKPIRSQATAAVTPTGTPTGTPTTTLEVKAA